MSMATYMLALFIRLIMNSWSFRSAIATWTHYVFNLLAAIQTILEFCSCCHHSCATFTLWYITTWVF